MLNPFRRKTSPADVWAWVTENRERIAAMFHAAGEVSNPKSPHATTMGQLAELLTRYQKGLFPYGGIAEDAAVELIVTAEGNSTLFPRVFELMAAAPTWPGWRFIPLKPPMPIGGMIQVEDVRLDVDALRFYINRDGARPVIMLLAAEDTTASGDRGFSAYQFLGQMTVDNLLGEYAAAREVDQVIVVTAARFAEKWGHDGEPISKLADAFPKQPRH